MTGVTFCRIPIAHYAETFTHAQHVIIIKDILWYLNECGWPPSHAYLTDGGFIQVRLEDPQDQLQLQRALDEFKPFSRKAVA